MVAALPKKPQMFLHITGPSEEAWEEPVSWFARSRSISELLQTKRSPRRRRRRRRQLLRSFFFFSRRQPPNQKKNKNFRGKELLLIQSMAVIKWCQKSFPNFAISKTSKQNTTEMSKERRKIILCLSDYLLQHRFTPCRCKITDDTTELEQQPEQQSSQRSSGNKWIRYLHRRRQAKLSTSDPLRQLRQTSTISEGKKFVPAHRKKHNNNPILPLPCSNTDLSQKIDRRRTGSFALWLLLCRPRRRRRIPRAAHHSSFCFSGLLPSNGTTKAFVKENLFTWKKKKKKRNFFSSKVFVHQILLKWVPNFDFIEFLMTKLFNIQIGFW
jgi:hypothetical protein